MTRNSNFFVRRNATEGPSPTPKTKFGLPVNSLSVVPLFLTCPWIIIFPGFCVVREGMRSPDSIRCLFLQFKVMQALLWCLGLGSGLCCVYLKAPWYQQRKPSTHIGELCFAFFDRILWSICVAWITFACCTKRGGESFYRWNVSFFYIPGSCTTI